jgi:tetratricopeptide (TPR) repeat protein
MSDAWEEVFAPEPVPEWLLAFESAPVQALDSLLGRRFYFGSLNAADPEELLVDWAFLLADANGFIGQLDEALVAWIEENWGIFPPGVSAARLADAWSRLANVVTYVEDLPRAAQALRDRFDDREDFLGPLSVGPSRDPLGRYLMAVAEHQEDRRLSPFWWRLCDLQDGVPFYHAPYAIAGLLGLPPLDESQAGGFREQAAWGVVRLAEALHQRIEKREVQPARARDEWLWTARRAMARLPFLGLWREIFKEAIHRGGLPETCWAWLELVTPDLTGEGGKRSSRRRLPEAFAVRSWRERGQSIALALRGNRSQALVQAKDLLREEEQYALLYGDSGNLVRSLTSFTSAVWDRDPELAVQWAEMALSWEPWNVYSWSTLTQARWKAQGLAAALPLAWETEERFPENAAARSGLAEILKESGRLAEAEAIYRQAIEDFPTNSFVRNGLAELLKETGRLAEAEAIYRQAIMDFPNNAVARTGLAEILKETGHLAEAEAVYRQAMVDFPTNSFVRNGLAELLKETGRLIEAAAVYRQAMVDFPTNAIAPIGLAAVLRLQGSGHWEEALGLVERVSRGGQNRSAALAEKGRLLERMERWTEAAESFETSRSFSRPLESPPSGELGSLADQETEGPNELKVEEEKVPGRPPQAPGELKNFDFVVKSPALEERAPTAQRIAKSRSEYRVTVLSRNQRAAWTSEARFLRQWARRGGNSDQGKSPGVLRRQAESLLKEVLCAHPNDVRALAEKGLLLLDSAHLKEARDLLTGAVERLPGTPTLLAALARLEREEARAESLRLSEESIREVFEAPDRLRLLGGGFEPLIHLQKGRAVLVLQDGQIRRDLAAKELDKLHKWVRPHLEPELKSFEAWWGHRLNEQVFLPIQPDTKVESEDVEGISTRLAAHAAEIDALEEAFGLRKDSRGASF